MQNIAVIGAGAAGLCAARHIASRCNMKVVLYEKTKLVGGTWNYTEETDRDEHGLRIHSSMYKNLRTNLPKQVMEFPDFPFDNMMPTFLTHEQVESYLESYCSHFNLSKYIQFEMIVNHVKPVDTSTGKKWEVEVKDLKQKTTSISLFDAVFVCNGHYANPKIPDICGHEDFKGRMMHSHAYRHPEVFADQVVVVLGARSSGSDISLDVAKYAKKVVISHRTPRIISVLPENVSQRQTIERFDVDGRTIHFSDGSSIEADSFIFCTGYNYYFPFLHPSCDIEVEDSRFKYLYNHTICVSHPSLIFVGICSQISPFPHFHYQVLYSLGVLDGSIKLPSKDEMMEEIENDYRKRINEGMPNRECHKLGMEQFDFNNKMADSANVPRLKEHVGKLYGMVANKRREMLCEYKRMDIKILKDGSYDVSLPTLK